MLRHVLSSQYLSTLRCVFPRHCCAFALPSWKRSIKAKRQERLLRKFAFSISSRCFQTGCRYFGGRWLQVSCGYNCPARQRGWFVTALAPIGSTLAFKAFKWPSLSLLITVRISPGAEWLCRGSIWHFTARSERWVVLQAICLKDLSFLFFSYSQFLSTRSRRVSVVSS